MPRTRPLLLHIEWKLQSLSGPLNALKINGDFKVRMQREMKRRRHDATFDKIAWYALLSSESSE